MLTSKFKKRPLGENGKGGWLITHVKGEPAPEWLSKLRIPPAWVNVKVATHHDYGKAIAIGIDEAGRKQYLYHPDDVADNKAVKFKRVMRLLGEWEDIGTKIAKDISKGVEEAIVALLLYQTGIRPGNESDNKAQVQAYGATTLLLRHVHRSAKGCRLKFVGKKGVDQNISVIDNHLSRVFLIRKKNGLPRAKLFGTSASKLREYFRTLGSGNYTPKDFRTACGTKLALELLGKRKLIPVAKTKRKKMVNEALDKVAAMLGNTRTVAKNSYVEPTIIERILEHRKEDEVRKRVSASHTGLLAQAIERGISVPKGANDSLVKMLIKDHDEWSKTQEDE